MIIYFRVSLTKGSILRKAYKGHIYFYSCSMKDDSKTIAYYNYRSGDCFKTQSMNLRASYYSAIIYILGAVP